MNSQAALLARCPQSCREANQPGAVDRHSIGDEISWAGSPGWLARFLKARLLGRPIRWPFWRPAPTPETLETLADVYAEQYHGLLEHVAKLMFWDWREAVKIAEEARSRLDARRTEIEARAARHEDHEHYHGVLLGAVSGTFTRVAVEHQRAMGYIPPACEAGIQSAVENFGMSEEWAAKQRAERAELTERIESLPAVLREPCRLWLDHEEIPESLGWYVRQCLTLLGRRKAAA